MRAFALVLLLVQMASAKRYQYQKYSELVAKMIALQSEHPTMLRLFTAQDRYGLPAVGNCASSDTKGKCLVYSILLTNLTSLEADPGLLITRPSLFISGTLHGNEWIGPHATVAMVEYVLQHYEQEPWLRFLLNERMTVVVPIANADGFEHNRREEDGIDPNRDFGFDVDPKRCMKTIAGRSINELFREHIFRIAITFHGGANVIAYQWGDTKHCDGYPRNCRGGYVSSDDKAMKDVGRAMSNYAGKAPSEGVYAVGPCNDPRIIYPVNGGMEDWAYGASWHSSKTACRPETHGGYPVAKSIYNNVTHRAPNFLVEAANRKRPPAEQLGADDDVLNAGGQGDGHIPRNIRLMLVGMDSIEPYIYIRKTSLQKKGEPPSSADHFLELINSNKAVTFEELATLEISVEWIVGGAFTVDYTKLHVVLRQAGQAGKVLSESSIPATPVGVKNWKTAGTVGVPPGAQYKATVSLGSVAAGGHRRRLQADEMVVEVYASAAVDGKWNDATDAQGDSPKTPQSHGLLFYFKLGSSLGWGLSGSGKKTSFSKKNASTLGSLCSNEVPMGSKAALESIGTSFVY